MTTACDAGRRLQDEPGPGAEPGGQRRRARRRGVHDQRDREVAGHHRHQPGRLRRAVPGHRDGAAAGARARAQVDDQRGLPGAAQDRGHRQRKGRAVAAGDRPGRRGGPERSDARARRGRAGQRGRPAGADEPGVGAGPNPRTATSSTAAARGGRRSDQVRERDDIVPVASSSSVETCRRRSPAAAWGPAWARTPGRWGTGSSAPGTPWVTRNVTVAAVGAVDPDQRARPDGGEVDEDPGPGRASRRGRGSPRARPGRAGGRRSYQPATSVRSGTATVPSALQAEPVQPAVDVQRRDPQPHRRAPPSGRCARSVNDSAAIGAGAAARRRRRRRRADGLRLGSGRAR